MKPTKKQLVADKLFELASKVELMESGPTVVYKKAAYIRAAKAVQNLNGALKSASQLAGIKGIGDKTLKKIEEILATGGLNKLDSFTNDFSELLKIQSVGPKKAQLLYNTYGVRTPKEVLKLIEGGKLVDDRLERNVRKTLKTHNRRLPRKEILEISNDIELHLKVACPRAIVQVCGSIRRELKTCKDIDIIFCAVPEVVEEGKHAFLNYDWDFVDAAGKTRMDSVKDGVAINIRFMDRDQYGSALLYFTGSGSFNEAMRSHAKRKGYKLSEYGLFKGDNLIASWLEADIFKELGIPYIEPKDRTDEHFWEVVGGNHV